MAETHRTSRPESRVSARAHAAAPLGPDEDARLAAGLAAALRIAAPPSPRVPTSDGRSSAAPASRGGGRSDASAGDRKPGAAPTPSRGGPRSDPSMGASSEAPSARFAAPRDEPGRPRRETAAALHRADAAAPNAADPKNGGLSATAERDRTGHRIDRRTQQVSATPAHDGARPARSTASNPLDGRPRRDTSSADGSDGGRRDALRRTDREARMPAAIKSADGQESAAPRSARAELATTGAERVAAQPAPFRAAIAEPALATGTLALVRPLSLREVAADLGGGRSTGHAPASSVVPRRAEPGYGGISAVRDIVRSDVRFGADMPPVPPTRAEPDLPPPTPEPVVAPTEAKPSLAVAAADTPASVATPRPNRLRSVLAGSSSWLFGGRAPFRRRRADDPVLGASPDAAATPLSIREPDAAENTAQAAAAEDAAADVVAFEGAATAMGGATATPSDPTTEHATASDVAPDEVATTPNEVASDDGTSSTNEDAMVVTVASPAIDAPSVGLADEIAPPDGSDSAAPAAASPTVPMGVETESLQDDAAEHRTVTETSAALDDASLDVTAEKGTTAETTGIEPLATAPEDAGAVVATAETRLSTDQASLDAPALPTADAPLRAASTEAERDAAAALDPSLGAALADAVSLALDPSAATTSAGQPRDAATTGPNGMARSDDFDGLRDTNASAPNAAATAVDLVVLPIPTLETALAGDAGCGPADDAPTAVQLFASAGRATSAEHLASAAQPISAEHPALVEHPASADHLTSDEHSAAAKVIASAEDLASANHLASAEHLASGEHAASAEQSATAEHVVSAEHPSAREPHAADAPASTLDDALLSAPHATPDEAVVRPASAALVPPLAGLAGRPEPSPAALMRELDAIVAAACAWRTATQHVPALLGQAATRVAGGALVPVLAEPAPEPAEAEAVTEAAWTPLALPAPERPAARRSRREAPLPGEPVTFGAARADLLRDLRRIWMGAAFKRQPYAVMAARLRPVGAGDAASLARTFEVLQTILSELGTVYDVGPATVAVVMPNVALHQAQRVAKAVADAIDERAAAHPEAPLRVALGVAALHREDDPAMAVCLTENCLRVALAADVSKVVTETDPGTRSHLRRA